MEHKTFLHSFILGTEMLGLCSRACQVRSHSGTGLLAKYGDFGVTPGWECKQKPGLLSGSGRCFRCSELPASDASNCTGLDGIENLDLLSLYLLFQGVDLLSQVWIQIY
jgi:hypothetical protein